MFRLSGDVKKNKRLQYERTNLQLAFNAITEKGMSVYKAARVYSVPESTLRDRTRGNVDVDANAGSETIFSKNEEEKFVNHITYMASIGYGYTKSHIQYMGKEYAKSLNKNIREKSEESTKFSNNWFYGLMKRWPELKLVKPQKLSLPRARSTSSVTVNKYFEELSSIMKENNLLNKPNRIYNIDETGISTEHSPPKIVCGKETKPQSVTSQRSSTVTIIAGGSAMGNFIPPYYVFPGKRWNPDFLNGAASGSSGDMSKTGWSNSSIFENYLKNHFTIHAGLKEKITEPLLVLFDGHRSHINLTLSDWAQQHNIILFVLQPHTSHVTQPLDVGVFGPMKNLYNSACSTFMQKNPGASITKYDVASLTCQPYLKAMSPQNLTAAFRKTGIFPFNSEIITADQTAPSTIYPSEQDTSTFPDKTANNTAPTNENAHVSNSASENSTQQVLESTSNDFFETRTIKTVTVVNKRKRKFVPPFISGDLAKKTNKEILESVNCNKNKSMNDLPPVKSKNSKSATCVASNKVEQECQPSTSGLNQKHLCEDSTDLASDVDLTDDEEVCCVCDKWQPSEMKELAGIVFIKWGKCDFCPHWTHLRFCTKVTVLRRGSVFRCPHCVEK